MTATSPDQDRQTERRGGKRDLDEAIQVVRGTGWKDKQQSQWEVFNK